MQLMWVTIKTSNVVIDFTRFKLRMITKNE